MMGDYTYGDPDYEDYPPPDLTPLPPYEPAPIDTTTPFPLPDPGNPYAPSPLPGENPSEGGPGGITGPGGTEPGTTGPQFNWTEYLKDPTGYLNKLLSGLNLPKNATMADVLKSIGLGDIGSLLPILLAAGGGINSMGATKEAAEKIQNAANNANDESRRLVGGSIDQFAPWTAAGTTALDKLMSNMNAPGLASKYRPVVAPEMPKLSGAMSLNDLAKLKR